MAEIVLRAALVFSGVTTTRDPKGNLNNMKRIIVSALVMLSLCLGVALATPAAAAQTGTQTVHVESDSWSGINVGFACGYSYAVPIGATWGELQSNPKCGKYTYDAEPSSVYVGPGWCVTRWVANASGWTYPSQVLAGGSTGFRFKLWWSAQDQGYTNHIESWYGGDCPSGGNATWWGYFYN